MISPLVLEAAAADELAHDGGWWNLLVADGQEVMDELQQAVGFCVFRTVLGYAGEYQFGVDAQHGELDVQGRVEHHVGRLLIGEYPLFLSLADVLPLADGLLCGESTFVVVADDAAQQPVVACRYPVVVVERDAGQRRDIDLVFQRVVYLLRQQGVQGVDALDDEHRVARQPQAFTVEFALAGDEVILWHLYRLALHQTRKVFT